MNRIPSPQTKLSAFIIVAFFWSCCTAFAQDPRLDLSGIEHLAMDAVETVDVSLEGPMLQMGVNMLKRNKRVDEAEIREFIDTLEGIYVRSFKFDKPDIDTSVEARNIRDQVRSEWWSRIIHHSNSQAKITAEVYVMPDDKTGVIIGLAIISSRPREFTVVNIIGQIDIAKLSAMEGRMGIPNMNLGKTPAGK